MKYKEVTRPVGLRALCEEVEHVCSEAAIYNRCGLRPHHLLVPLDPGCGRTTFVTYMTDMYKAAGVLEFASGPDDFLEIEFDGTLPQLRQAFAEVESAAVYTNEYCNIVSIDFAAIASHLGETQCTEFLKGCRKICETACVIFFVPTAPSRNEEKLTARLCETIKDIRRIEAEPYTREDLCELVCRNIEDHGVMITERETFAEELTEASEQLEISTVSDAAAAAETLIRYADFSGFIPFVNKKSLRAMVSDRCAESERRETK